MLYPVILFIYFQCFLKCKLGITIVVYIFELSVYRLKYKSVLFLPQTVYRLN